MNKPIDNPDTKNCKQKYWEQVLRSHNLAMERGATIEIPNQLFEVQVVPVGLLGIDEEAAARMAALDREEPIG